MGKAIRQTARVRVVEAEGLPPSRAAAVRRIASQDRPAPEPEASVALAAGTCVSTAAPDTGSGSVGFVGETKAQPPDGGGGAGCGEEWNCGLG